MRHGYDLTGKRLPFGCCVLIKPAVTRYHLDKANARARMCVFLGYRLAPGCEWNGDGLVADVDDLAKLDLDECADARQTAIYEHATKVAALPREGYAFPQKNKYELVNRTLEGGGGAIHMLLEPGDLPDLEELHDADEDRGIHSAPPSSVADSSGIPSARAVPPNITAGQSGVRPTLDEARSDRDPLARSK